MYASSSSLSSSHAICNEFVQPDPRQFPQAGVHSMWVLARASLGAAVSQAAATDYSQQIFRSSMG